MADYQVTCVDKPRHDSPYEAITHLGARGWRWTQYAVIEAITDKTNTFYVVVAGQRADLAVVHGPNGDHVQAHAGGDWNDALLTLKGCTGYL